METGDDVIDMDSSNTPSMISMVPVEMRDVDREEMTTVDEFMEKGCGCRVNYTNTDASLSDTVYTATLNS